LNFGCRNSFDKKKAENFPVTHSEYRHVAFNTKAAREWLDVSGLLDRVCWIFMACFFLFGKLG
jgi:hypothetical protein